MDDDIDLINKAKLQEEEMSDMILAEILKDPKAKHLAKEAVSDVAKECAL